MMPKLPSPLLSGLASSRLSGGNSDGLLKQDGLFFHNSLHGHDVSSPTTDVCWIIGCWNVMPNDLVVLSDFVDTNGYKLLIFA